MYFRHIVIGFSKGGGYSDEIETDTKKNLTPREQVLFILLPI